MILNNKNITYLLVLIIFLNLKLYEANESNSNERYSNQWVLKFNGNVNMARELAKNHNFKFLRQIGSSNFLNLTVLALI